MKRKQKKSPYSRTTEVLREQGFEEFVSYQKVEYFNRWAGSHGQKIDLFNIIDLLVLDNGILGIQVCSGGDLLEHIRKLTIEKKSNTITWLQNGGRLEIHGWRQLLKKKGGKAKKWAPRVIDVLLHDGQPYVEERK